MHSLIPNIPLLKIKAAMFAVFMQLISIFKADHSVQLSPSLVSQTFIFILYAHAYVYLRVNLKIQKYQTLIVKWLVVKCF